MMVFAIFVSVQATHESQVKRGKYWHRNTAKHLRDLKGLSITLLTILTIVRLLLSPDSNCCYLSQRLGPIMDAGTLGPTNRSLSLGSRT